MSEPRGFLKKHPQSELLELVFPFIAHYFVLGKVDFGTILVRKGGGLKK